MGSIYKITHVDTGRIYIGQTAEVNPFDRWINHKSAAKTGIKTYLYSAIRKYGHESFTFEVIESCENELLNYREQYYVALYESNNKLLGFNMSIGGDNGNNTKSPEVRAKISASKKGVKRGPYSPEYGQAISAGKLKSGYRHSEETRKNISIGRSGYTHLTDVHKQRISDGLNRTKVWKYDEEIEMLVVELCRRYSISEVCRITKVDRSAASRMKAGIYREKRRN